jgi:hypothetical protein
MDLSPVIASVSAQADDILAGVTGRDVARTQLDEWLELEFPTLPAPVRGSIRRGVMAVLEEEDFFGVQFVGDTLADDEPEGEE